MRANFAAQPKARANSRGFSKNKTWRRGDDVTQKEFRALVDSTKKDSAASAARETAQKRKAEPSVEDKLNNFAILKMETFSDSDWEIKNILLSKDSVGTDTYQAYPLTCTSKEKG